MSQISYTKKPDWNNDGLRANHVNANVVATPLGWMAPMPGMGGKAITGITWLAGTATVTCTGHGLTTGQDCLIYGVTPAAYNGYYASVTVTGANTFTVPVAVVSASPLTTPVAPTATPSTLGGTLATGNYYAMIVAVDGNGALTLAGPESLAAAVTGPTGSIAWAWTAVVGAVSYRIYVAATTPGSEAGYFTSTTNSYTQTATTGTTAGTPPSSNPGTYVSGGQVGPRGEVMYSIGGLDVVYADLITVPVFSVAAFTYSALAHMVTGDVATLTITMLEGVTWNDNGGIPSVTLNINATVRQMVFQPALSTSTSLVFKYTIVAGDVATAGQVTTGTTVTLNGGQLIEIAPDTGNQLGQHSQAFTPGTFVAPVTSGVSVN